MPKPLTHISAFKHDRKTEVRMMKLMTKLDLNKSQLIKHLINEAYEK